MKKKTPKVGCFEQLGKVIDFSLAKTMTDRPPPISMQNKIDSANEKNLGKAPTEIKKILLLMEKLQADLQKKSDEIDSVPDNAAFPARQYAELINQLNHIHCQIILLNARLRMELYSAYPDALFEYRGNFIFLIKEDWSIIVCERTRKEIELVVIGAPGASTSASLH